ncbi:synaptonemal complex central element protein 1-like isoform X1 [Dendropsophus ebraccatus]|uniref:synaptonemal complex central element protein 1-like isoform X1 n=2 Tax=Dendropsophus ebraccatus TaxID=150705 RepID=UPI0038319001
MVTCQRGPLSDMEALIRQAEDLREAGNIDPKMEEVLTKIGLVQKGNQDREQTEAEKQELDKEIEAAQNQLQTLYTEKAALKETVEKKQETLQILKLRRDNQLKKEKKQQEEAEETRKRMEDLTSKYEEEKMKQRKQRMEFQKQMEEIIKKHKALAQLYDEKRLGAEIERMKEQKKELLQEEKEKMARLKELEETEAKLREEGVLTPEKLFLRSEEAICAIKLFEEENKRVKVNLEEVTTRQTEAHNKYNKLKSRLEDAEGKMPEVSQASSHEPQPEISKQPGLSSNILFPMPK